MTFFETHRHMEHIVFIVKIHLKLCVPCAYVFQKKIIHPLSILLIFNVL